MLKKLNRKEEGISALEYALIAFLIALAIILGAQYLGSDMNVALDTSAEILRSNAPGL